MKRLAAIFGAATCVVMFAGCATDSGGGVMDKVLQDFGLQDRPEGYESASDKAFAQLDEIGFSEMQRLNAGSRHGEVKFEESDDLFGKFYKEVKVYEDFRPIDARPAGRGGAKGGGGQIGTIEYSYRAYQSLRMNTRSEAATSDATIATDNRGRDTFRYKFDRAGNYLGGGGEQLRQ